MQRIMASFWRALIDSFRPKVIALSLLPLGLIVVAALGLGYFYWGYAVETVTAWMTASTIWSWIDTQLLALGASNAIAIMAPLLVVLLMSPLLVIVSLLLVTMFMTPVLARSVVERRFPGLPPQTGSQFWRSLVWSISSTCLAFLALFVTLPLWLIPPLALILPPMIWGWLAYRVMSFDTLLEYTSASERQNILEEHRWPLLLIGIVCGFLSAAPSLVWASGIVFAFAFVVLIPIAVWLFTWVFALTSLWYAHYCLDVLAERRGPQALLPNANQKSKNHSNPTSDTPTSGQGGSSSHDGGSTHSSNNSDSADAGGDGGGGGGD